MKVRTLTAFLVILSFSVESTFAAFSDTSLSFYRDAVTTLSAEGVISGFGDGTFGPEKSITRAEILKVFLKAKGTPLPEAPKTRCFRDVATTLWYHAYICEGVRLGIVKGFENGTFGPDTSVTTLEALAMGLRLYGIAPVTPSSPWYLAYQNFADTNDILDSASYSLVTPISRGKASELILKIREFTIKSSLLTNVSRGCKNPGTLASTNTVQVAGKDRSYILSIPARYTSGKAVGLVVAIHGRTNSNAMVQGYMGLE